MTFYQKNGGRQKMSNNLKYKVWVIILVGTLLPVWILTGCMLPTRTETDDKTTNPTFNQTGITAGPNDERLTFQGKVISIDPAGNAFLVAVAEKDQPLLGDKATVGLYAGATVTRADTGKAITLKDVPADSEVTVTITGGIRESYPVQVSAVSVLVALPKN